MALNVFNERMNHVAAHLNMESLCWSRGQSPTLTPLELGCWPLPTPQRRQLGVRTGVLLRLELRGALCVMNNANLHGACKQRE